ncbi:patatin-like phospholipase family protein, partial [Paraburkholderia sp. BR14262]
MMNRRRPKRVGLVLGGGAARGWAHIGAIRALEEAGIKPDVVCGTSIGALVGAVYANGDLDWLEDWVGKLTWQTVVRLLDLRFSGGLLGGRKVIDLFAHQFNGRSIDDLRLPFTAVATELDTGREVWLREGGVVDAVRASIAIPGIFTPIWHDGVWLVDGGLSNPVPVSAARAMRADTVIAIDLNHDILNGRDLGGAIDTMPRELPVEASD